MTLLGLHPLTIVPLLLLFGIGVDIVDALEPSIAATSSPGLCTSGGAGVCKDSEADDQSFPSSGLMLLQKKAVANDIQQERKQKQFHRELEERKKKMHYVYTAGCNDYQLYQDIVLDWSWREVNTPGKLTRIVMGCKTKEEREMQKRSPLRDDPNFHVFFAEGDLAKIPTTGEVYPARARPHAIEQWLGKIKPADDQILAILDPDFAFLRPLSDHPGLSKVRKGLMLAQPYGLGSSYLEDFVRFGDKRPNLSARETSDGYSSGPPWALQADDLKRILPDWKKYTDGLPKNGDGLLREQIAFAMSALKNSVPMIDGGKTIMVSAADAWNEGWDDDVENPETDWNPTLLHYCQTYEYKGWAFHKALISSGWYSAGDFNNRLPSPAECGAPYLQEPPKPPTKQEEPKVADRRRAFMLSHLIPRLNGAFAAYRQNYCESEKTELPEQNREGKRGGAGDTKPQAAASGLLEAKHEAESEERFMRTMQPVRCGTEDGGKGVSTRYLVAAGSPKKESKWSGLDVSGEGAPPEGAACAKEAQTYSLEEEA